MENKIKNSCDGRGCRIYILPIDRRFKPVYSKVLPKRYDIQKILYHVSVFLDKVA